ncbi:NAD(P)-binding domain-containing protein [Macrococcoides caseolyticum]|uniref:NAD(P)-binding domain-containing protein n=1 Tax=Macrococcoides caseolyticum TaxID=69966 RepID=UPI001F15EB7B|nr:NAD(P)-binding domain-containing protein [Macrococcus caseolyticus]MCE4956041.1 NAD-binding protein [Macrococcus caseolyticus]
MNIGFIGLGIMGRPMAKHMVSAGHQLFVSDLNVEAVNELVSLGAKAATPKEIAENTEVIITMLPNGAIVKSVLTDGETSLLAHLNNNHFVIDMSSLTPDDSKYIGEQLSSVGAKFADAPVSGGEPLAITGELAVMVGCHEEDFDYIKETIAPMSKSVIRVGDIGSGSLVKLANQIIVNTNIVALSEAVVLGKKFDIDLDAMFEAIRYGLAGSAVMEAKFPKMIAEDYQPGGTLNINVKDLKNVVSTCDNNNITLPVVSMVKEMYKSEVSIGNGMNDHSGIIKYIERINGLEG